jgi:hypothetical protein
MTEDQPTPAFNPDKINQVAPDRLQFPLRYSREAFEAPTGAEVTEFERTPEGWLELEWEYKEVQHALFLDHDHHAGLAYSREELQEHARPHFDAINQKRANLEDPASPIDIGKVGGQILRHLIRPNWQEYLPADDSEQSLRAWEDFKGDYPEHMQVNLEELRVLDGKLRILSGDEQLRGDVQEIHADRIKVMRAATGFLAAERKSEALSDRIAGIYRASGVSNRALTSAEQRHIERLRAQQERVKAARGAHITTPEMKDKVKEEVHRRIDIERRRDFERGLVMTKQMHEIIDEILPSISAGKPALLVGETGGAKTALAEFISRQYFGVEPEFISGYGDVNSYQVMGKMSLENKDGVTVSEFVPGPMVRAMESGRPLILDEINAMPAEFLKRLNKIAQLRPGDTFTVQEDSGREVTVKSGFVILATANEKSKRYKGVEDLSVEFQNRFGANVVRIHYPDHNVVYGQPPIENAIIAKAALTDRAGGLVGGIEPRELERFVKACHVTQQVFTGKHGEGFDDYVDPERKADGKPGLDETVLAPRTMVALLEKVRDSHGTQSLNQVIERFVSGVKSASDRRIITEILKDHDFMQPPED